MQQRLSTQLVLLVAACWFCFSCGSDVRPKLRRYEENPDDIQKNPLPEPKRLFLDNGKVRLGIDLNAGGAITYLAEGTSGVNMVNNADLGRQLQTSLYSGPIPYSVNGKDPVTKWIGLGWNPVQTGDVHNNPAQVISHQQTGNTQLYVKTIPNIWPLLAEPADCVMEHWIELRDNTVHVRSRTTINRTDTTQYEARTQEAPCVYLNGPYTRIITYTGLKPFTNDAVNEFKPDHGITDRYATENWTALLNASGRGVGLYRANEFRFITAYFGAPGVGTEYDESSSYMAAVPFEVLDHNRVYEFEYDLIVGSLDDIRQFAYRQTRPATIPDFRFSGTRARWFYYNTRDTGWPTGNELTVRWARTDTTKASFQLKSPAVYWNATDVPVLEIEAAFSTPATAARFIWRQPGDIDFLSLPTRTFDFPITGDGIYRTYRISLAGKAGWQDIISQIGLEPTPGQPARSNATVKIRRIGLGR